jgi:hypothetical protein
MVDTGGLFRTAKHSLKLLFAFGDWHHVVQLGPCPLIAPFEGEVLPMEE